MSRFAALALTGSQDVIFSKIETGGHMGIATSKESRAREGEMYAPAKPCFNMAWAANWK